MKTFDRNDPELWEILPPDINWLAFNDYVGDWFTFKKGNNPFLFGRHWKQVTKTKKVTQGERLKFISIRLDTNWQDSLTERPR